MKTVGRTAACKLFPTLMTYVQVQYRHAVTFGTPAKGTSRYVSAGLIRQTRVGAKFSAGADITVRQHQVFMLTCNCDEHRRVLSREGITGAFWRDEHVEYTFCGVYGFRLHRLGLTHTIRAALRLHGPIRVLVV